MTKTIGVVITGRVQGVGYRAWCQTEAMSLSLSGWVRNRRDGSVEANFAGLPEDVEEMLRRVLLGPPGAKVSSVEPVEAVISPDEGFLVLPTA